MAVVPANKPGGTRKGKPTADGSKISQDVARKPGVEPNVAGIAGGIGGTRTSRIAYLCQTVQHKRQPLKGWAKRKKR